MSLFENAGEAMLAAEEGKAQMARALAATFQKWGVNLKDWLSKMPTTLPPTESYKR